MSYPSLEQLIALQNRLAQFADEGAVGKLSQTDVALLSYSLGYTSGSVQHRLRPATEADWQAFGKEET